jgi:hypothetical protein
MNLSDRDRRALSFLGVSVLLSIIWYFVSSSSSSSSTSAAVVAPVDSVEHAEKSLTRLRKIAATVPGKQEVLKKVSDELAGREKGLIKGDTAAQAQAQLVQIVREVARNQTPPLDIRQVELGPPRAFGDFYGEVSLSVTIECRIDQLVNYLTYLSTQPEIIATDDIRFVGSNGKLKTDQVRLTIAGLVPRKLVPVRKGVASF